MVKKVKNRFERIGFFYFIALAGIALTIIISQLLIQNHIAKQQDDSRVINLAGRQRMLSQQISKIALQIVQSEDSIERVIRKRDLQKAIDLWSKTNDGLLKGDEELELVDIENSALVQKMFLGIIPNYGAMLSSAESLINSTDPVADSINSSIIIENEKAFLEGMDAIVFQYDREAKAKVESLKNIEIALFVVAILIIIFEFFFLFRPLAQNIRKTVADLVSSETTAKAMLNKIDKLYRELGRSYQDLEAVNLEPEQPSVYAKFNKYGDLNNKSQRFINLIGSDDLSNNNFLKWLGADGYKASFLEGLLKIMDEGKSWYGEIKVTNTQGDFAWLDSSIVPVFEKENEIREYLFFARDMTEIKEAKMRSREINKELIDKKVKEYEYRSELIFEGQEEERTRIARELHDGVGQILTALKMTMESITPSSSRHTKKRIEESRDLLKNLIGEVRRISFNLRPTNLTDFGMVAALKKFSSEMSNMSGIKVVFENKTRFINRLDNTIETNLYRIVQETVNNAIKYSGAKVISITFEHNFNYLNISVVDDGCGFDLNSVKESGHMSATGNGLFNIRERAAYIDSKLEIKTAPGEGTSIFIQAPLD